MLHRLYFHRQNYFSMAGQLDIECTLEEIRGIIREERQANGDYSFIHKTYQKPIETLRELIKQEPLNYDAYYLLAQIMKYLGNDHPAISYLKKCHGFKPEHTFLLEEIEEIEENKRQRSVKGLAHQFERLEKDPNCTAAMGCLATGYTTIGDLDEALKWRLRAIETAPDDWEQYYNIGWTYSRLGEMDKCIESFKKALAMFDDPEDPENPEWDMRPNINKTIGKQYEKMEDYETAESHFRLALDLADPSLKKYYYSELADNLKKQKKFEEAIVYFNLHKSTDTEKYFPTIDSAIGYCYYNLNDKVAAKAHYQQCAKNNPGHSESFYCLGVIASEEGDEEFAKMLYQMALQANGNNMAAHYNLGMIAFREKNYKQTVDHFLRVVELDIFNDKAYEILYHAYNLLTEDEKAEEALMHSVIIKEIKTRKEKGA